MTVTAQISNAQVKHLIKSLRAIGDKKEIRRIVNNATRRALKEVILPVVIANTPQDTGQLKRAAKVRPILRSKKSGNYGSRVGYSARDFQGDEFYAAFIELGWRVGKRGREIRNYQKGALRRTTDVVQRHEAYADNQSDTRRKIPGKRMLRDTAETHGPKAVEVAAKYIQRGIIKLLKKQGKMPSIRIKRTGALRGR
jgi:hypothetical protein